MIFGILIGIVIGYIFKPQIDNMLRRLTKQLRDEKRRRHYYD